MKIASIVGARPQFIKAAILSGELQKIGEPVLINTGQHYDINMSEIFFEEFRLRADHDLKIGSGTHGVQTGRMLQAVEQMLLKEAPDVVLVYGDTNTTLAGALAAAKIRIPLAHVEAGLRSYNRAMPEEINRVVADHVSDILFAPTKYAMKTLASEGLDERSHLVGDVMVQILRRNMSSISKEPLKKLGLKPGGYVVCTLHRPENVDSKATLRAILKGLALSGKEVVIPLHPRTRKRISEFKINRDIGKNIRLIPPAGYHEMLALMRHSEKVCTDSGGVQKEAYVLKRPCITVRNETEWIETVEAGWNVLTGPRTERIASALREFKPRRTWKDIYPIPNPAERICEVLQARIRV